MAKKWPKIINMTSKGLDIDIKCLEMFSISMLNVNHIYYAPT